MYGLSILDLIVIALYFIGLTIIGVMTYKSIKSTGDFFERRYGATLGAVYALMGLLFFALNTGIMLKGTATTIDAVTLGALPADVSVIIMTILFVTYSVLGGLVAAVITDLIQGFFILVLSFLLIPFAINAAGGISAIHQGLPEQMFSFVAPQEVTLFFITMVVINGLVGIVVQPHHMAVGGSGKTEISCRTGWTYGNFLKRIATLGWAFVGVFAAFFGIGFWVALFWRRANRYGVYASLIASIASALYTGDSFSWGLHWSLPAQIALYLPAGFVAFIIASLMTKPESDEKLNAFYTLLQTPVGEEQKLKEAGVEIVLEGEHVIPKEMAGVSLIERGHSLLLVDLLKLHKKFSLKHYKIDLAGFAAAVLFVALIMLLGFIAAGIGG